MENKVIYSSKLDNITISNVVVDDDTAEFTYDKGSLKLESYHEQDCCEKVYADFSVIKYYFDGLKGKDFDFFEIKSVESMGFLACFYSDYNDWGYDFNNSIKIFVPCYNSQNGYYSDELKLIVTHNYIKNTEIDISNYVEDNIN